MAQSQPETLLEFPTEFPIKVTGRREEGFAQWVATVVQRHAPDFDPGTLEMRPSKNGNYLAVTATIQATSKPQLDAIYRELTADARVLFAL
jgi:uncharacterized protein